MTSVAATRKPPRAAIERLAWDVSVPPDAIRRRRIQRLGYARTAKSIGTSRRKPPAQAVRTQFGVVGDSNRIQISPTVNVMMSAKTSRARCIAPGSTIPTRSGSASGRQDQVDRAGHNLERARPGRGPATAWSAPGATFVENDISGEASEAAGWLGSPGARASGLPPTSQKQWRGNCSSLSARPA